MVSEKERSVFPELLYVHEPVFDDKDSFDGYRTQEDAEEDDTIAVYQLVKVCRLKVNYIKKLGE